MAKLIDGKVISTAVKEEVKAEVAALKEKGVVPGLAVIIVGEDPASKVYVANKEKACEQLGMASYKYALPENTSETELLELINKLNNDKNVNGIIVQFDLTFTNKAWVEAERYHFLDFISSQSTMHRICKFDLDKAYINYVDPRMIEIMKEKVSDYNKLQSENPSNPVLKEKYLEILYSNPAGFRLTAKMTTNYRQLKTIYKQRRYHRLPEWQAFCDWILTLPYAELIVGPIDK